MKSLSFSLAIPGVEGSGSPDLSCLEGAWDRFFLLQHLQSRFEPVFLGPYLGLRCLFDLTRFL